VGIVKDLKTVEGKVHQILQKYPATRDSDKLLWLAYNSLYNNLKSVIKSGEYDQFKQWILSPDTPIFESLSRARRKIQEQHPELEGDKATRMETETEVREMMR
jgi:hypothetical protein